MKLMSIQIQKKDVLYIVLSVIILVAVLMLGFNQLKPSSGANAGVVVEVVAPVGPTLNTQVLDQLRDDKKSRNFVVPIDLGSGVGTTTPFGQL